MHRFGPHIQQIQFNQSVPKLVACEWCGTEEAAEDVDALFFLVVFEMGAEVARLQPQHHELISCVRTCHVGCVVFVDVSCLSC